MYGKIPVHGMITNKKPCNSAGLLLFGWVSKYREINFPTQY
jgi:hypothetical protein